MIGVERSDEMPDAWRDLLAGLTLLARGKANEVSPLHCEHGELTVMADPEQFSAEEIALLGIWGFHPNDDGGFYSFRFGSA